MAIASKRGGLSAFSCDFFKGWLLGCAAVMFQSALRTQGRRRRDQVGSEYLRWERETFFFAVDRKGIDCYIGILMVVEPRGRE